VSADGKRFSCDPLLREELEELYRILGVKPVEPKRGR